MIQKDPILPPKNVTPPFSRRVWWYLAMIEFGKIDETGEITEKDRTEVYENLKAINKSLYDGFYKNDLIWLQTNQAYDITKGGSNNLYAKLSEQEGEFYTIKIKL